MSIGLFRSNRSFSHRFQTYTFPKTNQTNPLPLINYAAAKTSPIRYARLHNGLTEPVRKLRIVFGTLSRGSTVSPLSAGDLVRPRMPYDHGGGASASAHAPSSNVHTCGGGACSSTKAYGQDKLRAFEPSSIAPSFYRDTDGAVIGVQLGEKTSEI